MEFHPLSQIFPLMDEANLTELAEDIKVHGLRESIELYNDKIIDGRNRYAACEMAGVEPHFMPIGPPHEAAALAYVISKNLKRRHLTAAQKAEVIEKLLKAQPDRSDRAIGPALPKGIELLIGRAGARVSRLVCLGLYIVC